MPEYQAICYNGTDVGMVGTKKLAALFGYMGICLGIYKNIYVGIYERIAATYPLVVKLFVTLVVKTLTIVVTENSNAAVMNFGSGCTLAKEAVFLEYLAFS